MLTDIALKALKPTSKPSKRSDGGGLFVAVYPSGTKHWGLACRVVGKQKFLTGGSYPEVGLREARDRRDAIKAQLLLGMAPTAQPNARAYAKGKAVPIVTKDSFETVAREWHETRLLGWSPRCAGVIMRRMEGDIFPAVGNEPIESIK